MKDKSHTNLVVTDRALYRLPKGGIMAKHTGIKKTPNGRFQARYFGGFDSKGKRQYPARTFDTQSEAIKWRAEQVSAKTPGQFESHGQTLGEYLDRWLAIKKQVLRENSWEWYRSCLDLYVRPTLGHIRLSRLSPQHIESLQADLLTRVSATSVTSVRIILNGSLKKAVRLGLIRSNPVSATDPPKPDKSKRYPLTVEEALRFLDAGDGSRLGLYFRLALATGIRPEEGMGLQWASVKLGERGVLTVNRVIHRLRGGGWRWHEPKSKKGIRSIVFPGELVARLADHRKAQLEQKLRSGHYWENNDLVFCSPLGKPLGLTQLTREFMVIRERAGLPSNVTTYDLRHAFVTFSLLAGVDAKTVSEDAGHASVAFTLDHYGHVLEEMRESASDKREELMKSRKT